MRPVPNLPSRGIGPALSLVIDIIIAMSLLILSVTLMEAMSRLP